MCIAVAAQARYERDKYEWEKYDKPSKLSNEYKTEDLETTLDAHAKAIYQSKIKSVPPPVPFFCLPPCCLPWYLCLSHAGRAAWLSTCIPLIRGLCLNWKKVRRRAAPAPSSLLRPPPPPGSFRNSSGAKFHFIKEKGFGAIFGIETCHTAKCKPDHSPVPRTCGKGQARGSPSLGPAHGCSDGVPKRGPSRGGMPCPAHTTHR